MRHIESQCAVPPMHQVHSARRIGACAGVIGSTLFVSVFTIEAWLRPGYDAASMYSSALSLGPRGWIQILNFIISGLFIVLFARGVAAQFGKAARIGVAMLILIEISLIASGLLVMDPATFAFFQMSVPSKLHYLIGAVVFCFAPATCFVFLALFSSIPAWRALEWWTLGFGIFIVVGLVLLKAAAGPPASNALSTLARPHSTRNHCSVLHLGLHRRVNNA